MKKLLLIVLIVLFLGGIAVPLYAQDDLTLEGLADKVEAIIELLTSMSDRLTAYGILVRLRSIPVRFVSAYDG